MKLHEHITFLNLLFHFMYFHVFYRAPCLHKIPEGFDRAESHVMRLLREIEGLAPGGPANSVRFRKVSFSCNFMLSCNFMFSCDSIFMYGWIFSCNFMFLCFHVFGAYSSRSIWGGLAITDHTKDVKTNSTPMFWDPEPSFGAPNFGSQGDIQECLRDPVGRPVNKGGLMVDLIQINPPLYI